MTKRICVFCAKGGIGRTMISLNLAGYYAKQGLKVLVIDRDPQGSATTWAALAGETPFVISKSRVKGFDIEIYDCPPKLAESELLEADVYIVPTVLDGSSHTIYLKTMAMMNRRGVTAPIIPVVNKFNYQRSEHKVRVKQLTHPVILKDRASFANYYSYGKTVYELQTRGRGASGARNDIRLLAERVKEVSP